MTIKIVQPLDERIVDDNGRPTAKFFQWLGNVTRLETLTGTGSPEGIHAAFEKRYYVDISVSPPEVYFKVTNDILGDRTKGWELTN